MLCTGDETTRRESPRRRREAVFTRPADGVPILVVDDDPNFCTAVARALASGPFLPFSVRGGADALRFLARVAPFEDAPRPAFVVLDFNLPDLDAPAVLAGMRAHPLHRTIPVLVVSQIPGSADETAALGAGAQSYQAKPSRPAALRDLLVGFWETHGDPGR
jgi:CheY-like chemotaxis protein